MTSDVLVVDTDSNACARIGRALSLAGFSPTLARSFEDASDRLQHGPFVSVIAAHHLAAHNGLHLVLRARAAGAGGAVVTTASPDPVLDREAADLGAVTVVAPWDDPSALLAVLERARDLQHV